MVGDGDDVFVSLAAPISVDFVSEFGAVAVVSGLIAGRTLTLPTFVEQAYKNYQTEAAFGAATILALLALVTLVLKEILERKTNHH